MIDSTPASRLLLIEAAAIEPILRRAPAEAFELPTVCAGWSVRDVLAHCAAALGRVTSGDVHGFGPAENQEDVDARRDLPLDGLLAELLDGYRPAAAAIAAAGGRLDAVALGVWVHGGDVREQLGDPDPYSGPGADLAIELLVDASAALPAVLGELPDRVLHLGSLDGVTLPGRLVADVETLVRLLTGRDPDPARYHLDGVQPDALRTCEWRCGP